MSATSANLATAEEEALRPTLRLLIWADKAPERIITYLWAALYVAGGSVAAEALFRAFGLTRLSMVFLAAVLFAALRLGRGPAVFAAVLAFVVYNFYLVEPRFTIQFATADDFLTLILFLTVALVTGSLAGRVRDEVVQRRRRERTLSTLFEASRLMSATDSETVLRERIVEAVAKAADNRAVLVADDGERHVAGLSLDGSDADDFPFELARTVSADPGRGTHRAGVWRARALSADQRTFGAVVWRAPLGAARSEDTDGLIDVLVDLGAAAVARACLSRVKAEMEAVTRAEQLRTALLSSMSHDFRTPLATILACASSLLEFDDKLEPGVRRDLLLNIQEDVERLNRFVANLLNMTKLESGVLEVKTEPVPVREVVDRVLHRLQRRSGSRRLTQLILDRDLVVEADPVLLEQALTNVAENAIHYSPDSSEVTVWAMEADGAVRIEVADEGDGVPARDLPRIFDKFYRVSQPRAAAQGAGLGLSISKGLVEAMSGRVKAGARTDGRAGLTVEITLPQAVGA